MALTLTSSWPTSSGRSSRCPKADSEMARALRVATARVSLEHRVAYLAELRQRRSRLAANGCRFWVYEDLHAAGAFTEFTEGHDAAALASALAASGDATSEAPLLTEVELT